MNAHAWFKSRTLAGAQELRLQMGHCLTGSNIVYGTGVFITISPSERHSGLTLRLLRKRAELWGTELQSLDAETGFG